ncbi:Hypothetical protein PHPALM_14433 [Phytophthora palmivora]|uniref:Uncharacterized protein n=1 Tax=Phytophthora palmivora TaxID=4796 RepID=A0A2P4XUS3_9STRA|nr:Hypothetical protein PHPALM_14433 [Phytophthora palmivora]
MASSKFISNNLVPTNSRIRNNAKRLAPLDPAHFAKTKMHQFPGPLQAAINEILAVRNVGELSSEREETRPPIPRVKHTSPKKSQPYGRRPEWRRYIRRIMLTKGIQGSTLARYRRLVGIVARKNLVQNYTSAAERVVKYRLEFRCAAMIQTMILVFLNRRRQEKARRRHKAAAKIQQEWRMILERKRQRQLVKRDRLAKLDLLLRLAASRSIQRSYRKYRHACYLHEEEQRQVHQEKKLQKARLKLLQRYQLWRERLNRDKIDRNLPFTAVGEEMPSKARVDDDGKEYSNHPEQSEPCAASPDNASHLHQQ